MDTRFVKQLEDSGFIRACTQRDSTLRQGIHIFSYRFQKKRGSQPRVNINPISVTIGPRVALILTCEPFLPLGAQWLGKLPRAGACP